MLALPARTKMREQAIRCYERQTYPHRELVIVEDAGTVGAKRNMACSRARGEIIIHWDDDDLFAPTRIEDQVKRLQETGKQITGYRSLLFWDGRQMTRYRSANPRYALGVSLCYRKEWWRGRAFPDVNVGEDNKLVELSVHEIVCVEDGGQIVARIHPGNTSPKVKTSEYSDVAETDWPVWFREMA